MQLSPEAIKEYQEIFEKEFNKKISYEEAEKQAISLLELFRIIVKY